MRRAIPLDLPPFTLVGATTRTGLLPGPLRDRFGFTGQLDLYEPGELEQVLVRSARLLTVTVRADGVREIAKRSRGTPASPTGCSAGSAISPKWAATSSPALWREPD